MRCRSKGDAKWGQIAHVATEDSLAGVASGGL